MNDPEDSPELRKRLEAFMASSINQGRSLKELIQSSDFVKGAESQRLRTYFTSICMEPTRDLDAFGKLLFNGDVDGVKADFDRRKDGIVASANAHIIATNQLFALRWGPTQTPIFNCLLLATIIMPVRRQKVLEVVRWLISIGVPVDGKDLSGTTALGHAVSTKPSLDIEFAKLLIDGGGDINHRNRYGSTCAHEFCMVWTPDPVVVNRATEAMRFFLSNGGDPNIADNDGVTPLSLLRAPWLSGLKQLAVEEEMVRKRDGCAFCGSRATDRNAVELMRCSRCKKMRYCAAPKGCQRADWARHKRECKP